LVKHASALGLALAALLCATPSQAFANRLKLNSYQLEPTRFVIEVEGTEALVQPWVRVSGSTARIWFSGIETLGRFEQGEAEAPVKSVTLRPAPAKTALLRIDLLPDHVIGQRDVEITRDGTRATIRIALPAAAAAKAATPVAILTASTTSPGANVAAPNAEPPVAAVPVETDATAQPPAIQTEQVQPPPASPEPAFKDGLAGTAKPSAAPASQKKADPKLLEPQQGQLSTVQMLLLMTVLLGGVYGVLRLKLRKRGGTEFVPTEIQVLGNKRLGARHQLLIVRALGQDHLISVNGGHTERIASSETLRRLPAPGSPMPTPGTTPPAEAPKSRLGLGLGSALRAVRGHELFASADAQRTADLARAPIGETPFGAELLDFVRTGETRTPALSESEAIAGLVRLRNRSS
jgi:flagellar biogenesis protein FliO